MSWLILFGISSFLGTVLTNPTPLAPQCLLWSQSISKRDDYKYTAGIGGHKLHTRAVLWNEARLTCEEEGGHLAIINSIAEATAISQIILTSEAIVGSPHPEFISIGFHDYFNEGQYTTIHGQSLARAGYTEWETGQPDNNYFDGTPENCGSILADGRLNDISCNVTLGFLCELPIY